MKLNDLEFIHKSSTANLYVFPEEADYVNMHPLDKTWFRMDSSVRETDDKYVLPESIRNRPSDSALIYFSLGSIGATDVELIERIIDVLSKTRHHYIASLGPRKKDIISSHQIWSEHQCYHKYESFH